MLCQKCNTENPTSAKYCSNCGEEFEQSDTEEQNDPGVGGNIAVAVFIVAAIWAFFRLTNFFEEEPQTAQDIRTEQIESEFSVFSGAHIGLESYIKQNMNDPDSYEHVETRYSDEGSHLSVRTVFRGNNALGGTVRNTVIATVALDGSVMEIISWD
jgi:hypothetical protein